MDANDYWISIIYFCFMVIFGSFFAMQLVLAQIMDSFAKDQAKKDESVAIEEEKSEEKLNMAHLFVSGVKKAGDGKSTSAINLKPGSPLGKDEDNGLPANENEFNEEKEVKIANNAEINKTIVDKRDDKA